MGLFQGAATPAENDHRTDYFPVYFQACKLASPVKSGIYLLGFSSLAPAIIATGISIKVLGRYRPQIWMGWIFTVVGLGLMSTVLATDSLAKSIGYVTLLGLGMGYVVSVGFCMMLLI